MLPRRRDVHHEMCCPPAKVFQVFQRVTFRLAGYEAGLTVRVRVCQNLQDLIDVIEIQLCRREFGGYGMRQRFYRQASSSLPSFAILLSFVIVVAGLALVLVILVLVIKDPP